IGSGRGFGQLGQLNVNAAGNSLTGNVTVHERTTIGVGNVSANVLTVNSTGGNIIFQPTNLPGVAFTLTPSITTVSARATSAGATITQTTALTLGGGNHTVNSSGGTILDNSTNSFGGNVSVIGGANNTLVTNSAFGLGNATSVTGTNRLTVTAVDPLGVTARNISIVGSNAANVTLNASGTISVTGNSTFANLTMNATTGVSQSAALTVNNTLTVGSSTSGAVALGANTSNSLANVVVTETPGGITVGTTGNLTVRGSTSGAVTASAGVSNIAGTYGISLGNLTAGSLTLSAANGTGNITTDGVSGAITQQSGTSLGIFGPISATTFGGNITLANANNNFGRIDLNTGSPAAGVITLVERDTAKLGTIASTGSATITSSFGGVIEDTVGGTTLNVPTLNVTANAGSILLGGTTQTLAATTGTVATATLTTGGAAAITSTANLTLAASSANSLTASTTQNLAQSGKLSVYGLSTFTAGGNITLGDSGNNFGPVSATVVGAGSSISITENSTLNLRKVTMAAGSTGSFTAQSVNGDIVDSGLGGVVPGGRTGAGNSGTGLVSLTAQNGNVVIDDPTSDIATSAGVSFNAKNVTLSVLGGNGTTPIVLGSAGVTSTAAGNLTVTSATGNIGNAGNVTATGLATLQTGNGTIGLTAAGNQFGSVRFSSAAQGASTVVISQIGNMSVLTGSSAVGGVTLASGGNITITNSGGGVVSFGNTALLSATGSITLPKLVQAAGTITVNAAGTKDLSALSLSGDLGSKNPVNFGAGSYLPPSP
ncbi:MAG: beta strand repeat-containing protein, partial [Verrucomicrobiota bacterium]